MRVLFLLLLLVGCSGRLDIERLFACGEAHTYFSGGEGTQGSPYKICRISDLEKLDSLLKDPATYDTFKGAHYLQTRDIDLKSEVVSFLPLGLYDSPLIDRTDQATIMSNTPSTKPFIGTYDGNGKKIKNMRLEQTGLADYQGFFRMLGPGSVVKNLTFQSPRIVLEDTLVSGTLTGYLSGRVENVSVAGISATLDKAGAFGGVIGLAMGAEALKNMTSSGSITASLTCDHSQPTSVCDSMEIAGIVAAVVQHPLMGTTEITSLTNSAQVTGGDWVAGVISVIIGSVQADHLTNKGAITGQVRIAGVIDYAANGALMELPDSPPSLLNLSNTGTITANCAALDSEDRSKVAGIISGLKGASVNHALNLGEVKNLSLEGGRAAGFSVGVEISSANTLTNITNHATITSTRVAAGLIAWLGKLDGGAVSVSHLTNTGNILVTGNSYLYGDFGAAAGIIDHNDGVDISDVMNSGDVHYNALRAGSAAGVVRYLIGGTHTRWGNTGDITLREGMVDDSNLPLHFLDVAGLVGFAVGDVTLSEMSTRGTITAGNPLSPEYEAGGIIADIYELDASLIISNVFVASVIVGGNPWANGAIVGVIDLKDDGFGNIDPNAYVSITNAYYNSDLTTRGGVSFTEDDGSHGVDVTPLQTLDMYSSSNFSGFDFVNIWKIPSSGVYPSLK